MYICKVNLTDEPKTKTKVITSSGEPGRRKHKGYLGFYSEGYGRRVMFEDPKMTRHEGEWTLLLKLY